MLDIIFKIVPFFSFLIASEFPFEDSLSPWIPNPAFWDPLKNNSRTLLGVQDPLFNSLPLDPSKMNGNSIKKFSSSTSNYNFSTTDSSGNLFSISKSSQNNFKVIKIVYVRRLGSNSNDKNTNGPVITELEQIGDKGYSKTVKYGSGESDNKSVPEKLSEKDSKIIDGVVDEIQNNESFNQLNFNIPNPISFKKFIENPFEGLPKQNADTKKFDKYVQKLKKFFA